MSPATPPRIAVITGCSEPTSLGAAFARELHNRGWRVFATARNPSTLRHLEEVGCNTLALDVTSETSVAEAAKTITTLSGGRIDLLINNAGAAGSSPSVQTDPAKFAQMHDLHVLGPLRLTQAFFPYLKETASPDRRGKIVNIGSVMSNGMPWHAAYASTKAGAQVLSDVMRRELRPFNIDVITVELGLVKTALLSETRQFNLELKGAEPLGNLVNAIDKAMLEFSKMAETAPRPDEIATSIIDAVESRSSPRKLYLGKNNFLFRWIVPILPISVADALFSRLMHVDMVVKA